MKKTYIDKPNTLPALRGARVAYSDAVRIDLADHTLLYVSGKIGTGPDGKVTCRDMRGQTKATLENIRDTIERQGGTMTDIVRFRIYVSAIDEASIRDVHDVRREYFKEGEFPASTLVRVDQFVRDGALIEIEADVVMRH